MTETVNIVMTDGTTFRVDATEEEALVLLQTSGDFARFTRDGLPVYINQEHVVALEVVVRSTGETTPPAPIPLDHWREGQ